MKKISLAICASLLLALGACSDNKTETPAAATPPAATTTTPPAGGTMAPAPATGAGGTTAPAN